MKRVLGSFFIFFYTLQTLATPVLNIADEVTGVENTVPEQNTQSFSDQVEQIINELDGYNLKNRLASYKDEDQSYQDTEEFHNILQRKLDEHAEQGGNLFDQILAVNRAHAIAKELDTYNKRNNVEKLSDQSVEDQIIKINYKENDLGLFEGDVWLDPLEEALVKEGNHLRRKKRNAVRSRKRLWPDRIIRFYIHSSANHAASVIRQAANLYNSKTCVKWVEISARQAWGINHVAFKKDAGCWSRIGRLYWKKAEQVISVGNGCDKVGTMLHEMMHAIGFWHEQARPDRDSFVNVNWDNILAGQEDQFEKLSHSDVDELDLQYDYNSLMHYGKKSFTANGKNTISSSLMPGVDQFGSETFTQLDLQKIDALYFCSSGAKSGWTPWSKWSPCDPVGCQRQRERICLSSEYRQERECPGAKDYYGVDRQTEQCPTQCPYPINGMWNKWSAWSSCSVNCGEGTRTRSRKCDDPKPLNSGKYCAGSSKQTGTCYSGRCTKGVYDNEFERGWGGWKPLTSSRYAKWQLQSGPSKFWGTGPSTDHTTGKGTYALMETSWGEAGDSAQLWSYLLPPTKYSCLSFWYHMWGKNIGSLWVYVEPVGKPKWVKWYKIGDQGDRWLNAAVTVEMPDHYYKIMFEGKVGNKLKSGYSDYGIDDVYLDPGKCPELCEDAPDKSCENWAKQGECKKNSAYMSKSCCLSCKKYKDVPAKNKPTTCKDESTQCSSWAKKGECKKNPNYMLGSCCASCKDLTCIDESVECQRWAKLGECTQNPEYMAASCRLSCKKC